MRKKMIFICAFFVLIAKTYSQSGYNDSIRYNSQIIKIEQQLLDAIPAGDTAVWSKYLDENYYIKSPCSISLAS